MGIRKSAMSKLEAIRLCRQRACEMRAISSAKNRHQIIALGLRHYPKLLKSYPYEDLSQYSLQSNKELLALTSYGEKNITAQK